MRTLVYIILIFSLASCSDDATISPLNSAGSGGSLARFTIDGDRLYVVNTSSLTTYDISQGMLTQTSTTDIGIGIETIFPYQGYLFIGANDAMYIYDISDSDNPTIVSTYSHFTSCDPVVVNGNYAYVSLRAESCGQFRGESVVEIIDVSDLSNPVLVNSLNSVLSPFGIGINGSTLYVCQGSIGLKIINVADPLMPVDIGTLDVDAYDVIITQNRIILTGADGIYQYDIINPGALQFLSKIAVGLK
jgi:hypothetical protein